MVPLSSEKLHQILKWRVDVARTSSPYDLYALSIEPLLDPLDGFHHPDYFGFPGCSQGFNGNVFQHHQTADMDPFDMDRYTALATPTPETHLVNPLRFRTSADPPVSSFPALPLVCVQSQSAIARLCGLIGWFAYQKQMTTDLELLHEEYLRVLDVWNKFELEKWQAEKMLRGAATPDNVQRVFAADHAVESASAAARYIETYAKMHGIRYNFEGLFFKYYQSSADVFGFYAQAPSATIGNNGPCAVKGSGNVAPSSAWNASRIPSMGFGYNPAHGQSQQNMPFTACVPEWTVLPAPVPSRMIEV
ncbi:hypothetical protein H1R20_g3160, partial [Candolleomyces eurysporus]